MNSAKEFTCSQFDYKRHLTLQQAEDFKKNWDYDGDDELRHSRILYKKKSNDYTVVYGRKHN